MAETVLSLRGISKQFGAVSALSGIDLDVKAGEVVALVGDNGAGKSTLVKVLAGVFQPTSGEMSFQAKPVSLSGPGDAIALGIATVFQDLALCENLDVVANIFLGREMGNLALDEVAMELRSWTLLNELAARIPSVREPVASLSGGQRQTVAIARSLLSDPKLIMLDEPTAALGVAQTAEVLNLIERVRDRGLGVIMISHNMEDVRAVADRIVVLRLGRNNGVFGPDAPNNELISAITVRGRQLRPRAERADARRPLHERRPPPSTAAMSASATIPASAARSAASSTGCARAISAPCPSWSVWRSSGPYSRASIRCSSRPTIWSTSYSTARPWGVIALGIVCVLMVGEIDLSVGSVSGLASAMVGVLWVNTDWPVPLAILVALAAGAAIGAVYAVLFNRLSMPSFVSTLAGLLAVLGLQLYILGASGSINLPYGSPLVSLGQTDVMPAIVAYALSVIAGGAVFLRRLSDGRAPQQRWIDPTLPGRARRQGRRADGRVAGGDRLSEHRSRRAVDVRAVRRPGRGDELRAQAHAVGPLDHRRRRQPRSRPGAAGINVQPRLHERLRAVRHAGLARRRAVGGTLGLGPANRPAPATFNLNAIAAAVIGGTSLFGGRGNAYSALLGIIVIQSIASGLTLLDLSSSLRYMITGAVLAIAVIVDSLARRSRMSHGRA